MNLFFDDVEVKKNQEYKALSVEAWILATSGASKEEREAHNAKISEYLLEECKKKNAQVKSVLARFKSESPARIIERGDIQIISNTQEAIAKLLESESSVEEHEDLFAIIRRICRGKVGSGYTRFAFNKIMKQVESTDIKNGSNRNRQGYNLLTAYRDGKLIGFSIYDYKRFMPLRDHVKVDLICSLGGAGTPMMEAIESSELTMEDLPKLPKKRLISLDAITESKTLKFYRKNGFNPIFEKWPEEWGDEYFKKVRLQSTIPLTKTINVNSNAMYRVISKASSLKRLIEKFLSTKSNCQSQVNTAAVSD